MRVAATGTPGELASRPEAALGALATLAEADGADRDAWLEKAVRSVGATAVTRASSGDPQYRVVEEKQQRALLLYRAMWHDVLRRREARLLLERARVVAEAVTQSRSR